MEPTNGPMPQETQSSESQTFGMKSVGSSFNPGGHSDVDRCKMIFANAIDQMNTLRSKSKSVEQKRLCSIAITEAQGAQMWAVKAITWKD